MQGWVRRLSPDFLENLMKTKLWVFSFITALTAAGFIFWPNPVETSEYAKPRVKMSHDAAPLPEGDNRFVISKQASTERANSIETKAVALKLKQVAIKHQQFFNTHHTLNR